MSQVHSINEQKEKKILYRFSKGKDIQIIYIPVVGDSRRSR